jgi:hypothetical protein
MHNKFFYASEVNIFCKILTREPTRQTSVSNFKDHGGYGDFEQVGCDLVAQSLVSWLS